MGKGSLQGGIWSQMGPPVIRLLPQGDRNSVGAADRPDGWIGAQIGGGGTVTFGCLGSGGTAWDKREPAGDWQLQRSLPT